MKYVSFFIFLKQSLMPSKQRVSGSKHAERAIYSFYAKYSFIIIL